MSTQMHPTDFRERLDEVLRADGDPALGVAVAGDMTLGRRMIRRRRTGIVGGTVSMVALAVVLGGLVVSGDEPTGPTVADSPTSATELLAACRDGNQTMRATQLMFGGGDPEVKVVRESDRQTVLALEAADGRHWAACWVDMAGAEFPSGMEVYDATKTTPNSMFSSGPACALVADEVQQPCDRFSFTVIDRRPAEVAAVQFWTADGKRTTVQSVDGYIVLNYVGNIPDNTATTPEGLPIDFAPMKRITFLDTQGNPIAAEAQDGSGTGRDGEGVDGLPSIRAFPALRGGQSIH